MSGSLYGQKAIRKAVGANAGVPVGTILPDAGRIPPPGFLGLCIGAPVVIPTASYPQLVARTWCGESVNNEADFFCRCTDTTGSTKDPAGSFFILPDMSPRFVRGRFPDEDARNYQYQDWAVEHMSGEVSGSPNYRQSAFLSSATGPFEIIETPSSAYFSNSGTATAPGPYGWNFEASRVVKTDTETRPMNLPFNWIIKAFDEVAEPAQADLSYLTNELNALTASQYTFKDYVVASSGTQTVVNLTPEDCGKVIHIGGSEAVSIYLPRAAECPVGATFLFRSGSSSHTETIYPLSGDVLGIHNNSGSTAPFTYSRGVGGYCHVVRNHTGGGWVVYDVGGNLGQNYCNVTAQRAANINYYNATGKPIFVAVNCSAQIASACLVINGVAIGGFSGISGYSTNFAIVPPHGSYRFSGTFVGWFEFS